MANVANTVKPINFLSIMFSNLKSGLFVWKKKYDKKEEKKLNQNEKKIGIIQFVIN